LTEPFCRAYARQRQANVPDALVDTGSELVWMPEAILHSLGIAAEKTKRFVTATGDRATRWPCR